MKLSMMQSGRTLVLFAAVNDVWKCACVFHGFTRMKCWKMNKAERGLSLLYDRSYGSR